MLKNNKSNVAPGQNKQPGLFGRVGKWLRKQFSKPDDADEPKIRPGFRLAYECAGGYPTAPGNCAARKQARKSRQMQRRHDPHFKDNR